MSSPLSLSLSADVEHELAAALHRQTPSVAAAAAAAAGAGGGAPDRAAAAAIRRQKAAQRARATTDPFSAEIASARSLADQNTSRREQLRALKDQLRDLQSQLSEALTLESRKGSKCRLARESVSEAMATNERLRSLLADSRVKRDMLAAILSEELQAVEALEAGSKSEMDEKVPKAVLWYDKFLGFRVIGVGGGVKFVFDEIDPQRPEKEYSIRISQRLEFIECDPHIKDIEDLAKDLDLNEHLYMFVRMAREKFQSSFMNETLPVSPVVHPDISAAPLPSPMVTSVNNRSEDAHNQTQSVSKNNVQLLPAKREATALSGASPGVLRRSPRLKGIWGATS